MVQMEGFLLVNLRTPIFHRAPGIESARYIGLTAWYHIDSKPIIVCSLRSTAGAEDGVHAYSNVQ